MEPLKKTERFGSRELTTIEWPAVECPRCGELVFTRMVGDVSCNSCGHDFHAHDHSAESCSGVECDDCGEAIPLRHGHGSEISGFEVYSCPQCDAILVVETGDGPQPLEEVIETEWVLNGRSIEDVGTSFEEGRWLTPVQTSREELVTWLLNREAEEMHSGFYLYNPEYTDAYLCFTEDYCVGYITWNWEYENPELGQLFILPAFRRQGIGSGFVQAWRDDVAGKGAMFNVNNPSSDMFRLLRSIGAIEVAENGKVRFLEFDWTGHYYDLPNGWVLDA